MAKRLMGVLLCVGLASGTLWAADGPFTGVWKLNPARSRVFNFMKVKNVGPNKFDLDLGGSTIETIVVDGSDQPGSYDTTLAVTPEAPDTWRVVRKSKGHTTIIGIWKLSADGHTLTDNFTSYRPNGTTFHLDYIYQRQAGGPGFDGTWESTTTDMSQSYEIAISPSGENGILLDYKTFSTRKNMQFDGKDYPIVGGNAPEGYTGSAHSVNDHTIEITDKLKGKHIDTQRVEASPDGKTLTFTISIPGQDKPNVQVFERE